MACSSWPLIPPLTWLLVATAGPTHIARADGLYFHESVGLSKPDGQLQRFFDPGIGIRVAGGFTKDDWAVEAYLNLDELPGNSLFGDQIYTGFGHGLAVRRLFAISAHTRAYLRGGLGRMSIDGYESGYGDDQTSNRGDGYAGRTVDYGAGIMVGGRVPALGLLFSPLFFCDCGPKVSLGGWFDVGRRKTVLHKRGASSIAGHIDSWALGFSLGGYF